MVYSAVRHGSGDTVRRFSVDYVPYRRFRVEESLVETNKSGNNKSMNAKKIRTESSHSITRTMPNRTIYHRYFLWISGNL